MVGVGSKGGLAAGGVFIARSGIIATGAVGGLAVALAVVPLFCLCRLVGAAEVGPLDLAVDLVARRFAGAGGGMVRAHSDKHNLLVSVLQKIIVIAQC